MPSTPTRRPAARLALVAVALAALLAAGAGSAAAERAGYSKQQRKRVEAVADATWRSWLEEVELILSDEELDAFLALDKDYQRQAFVERFWRTRDPYPDTARNEYRERWRDRVERAREEFGNLTEDRARMLLLNGFPTARVEVRCPPTVRHTDIWYYDGSDQIRRQFFLIFVQSGGGNRFRLWRPEDGLDEMVDPLANRGEFSLQDIRMTCKDGEKLVAAIGFAVNDPVGFAQLVDRIQQVPDNAGAEWVSTFASYSTDLPEEAATLPAELELAYPGRHQSRTVVQATLAVPRQAAATAELADHRSFNFLVTGEVIAAGELFDSFRYKFDLPAAEVTGEAIPLVFERNLRPGDYTLIVKLEDLNGARFFRREQPLAVPEVTAAMPPPPPADPETARLLAEANAAITSGETTLELIEPRDELLTGYRRFETLSTGDGLDKVTFWLDGRPVLTKRRPPYSVDLDLGSLPRTHRLRVVGYGADGAEVAHDELVINAGDHRFGVRLVEPRRGRAYEDSLRAEVEVTVPEGQAAERVELYLDETLVATLYQPPWVQPIVLPGGAPLAYVRAVAYLADGNSTEDLVFVNAPDYLEELDVQFVELYTTVLDRQGRPLEGLTEADFRVAEDDVEQSIARFEQVRDLPIWSAVLLDVSASMEESLGDARQAALGFFEQTIQPKDRAAVVTFNDRPNLAVGFTGDVSVLAGGLAGLKAERGTALYDAVVFALYYFNGVKGQKALVVLSDGKDESSRFTDEQTLEYARRAGVTVYTIALRDDAAHKKLSKLAQVTGGRSYLIQSTAELAPIYDQIQRELRSQYLVAYQSTNTTGSTDFRTVRLTAERPGVEVRTLQGYYP